MIDKQVEDVIRTQALWAAGGGLIPIPILDFVAVTGVQMDLVQKLCDFYSIPFHRNEGKSIISALVGTSIASIGSSFIKAIPGLGSVLGGVSMSILSGATTYAIGQVFATHFASGGTLDNLDVEDFRNFYKSKVEEGKKIVEELKQKEKTPPPNAQNTSSQQTELETKLANVKQLLDKGIITTAEYDEMRRRLFEEYLDK